MVSKQHRYLCASPGQAGQGPGPPADAGRGTTDQHYSRVEQEEDQEVHPGAATEQKECGCTEGLIPWLIFSDISSLNGPQNKVHQPVSTVPLPSGPELSPLQKVPN